MDTRYAVPSKPGNEHGTSLYGRLDSINMNAVEREHAKRDLRAAEAAVDSLMAALATVRGWIGAPRATGRLQTR